MGIISHTRFCHFGFLSSQTHRALAEAAVAASSLPPCRLARVDGLLGFFLSSNNNTHEPTRLFWSLKLDAGFKIKHFMLLLDGGAQNVSLLSVLDFLFFPSKSSCYFCLFAILWDDMWHQKKSHWHCGRRAKGSTEGSRSLITEADATKTLPNIFSFLFFLFRHLLQLCVWLCGTFVFAFLIFLMTNVYTDGSLLCVLCPRHNTCTQ